MGEMVRKRDDAASPADLARAGEEMRGRSDEHLVNMGEGAVATEPRTDVAAAASQTRAQPRPDRTAPGAGEPNTPLFAQNEADGLRPEWNEIRPGSGG